MLINIYQRGETKTMKKSSAWCMLVPGLVILFLFLMIPLLRVLVPSVFTGDYPFSAYVDFFKDEYYRKIFLRTVKIAVITTFVCMVGGIPTAYFISRCDKKWRGLLLSASIFPMMTNSVIRSFAWINILGSNGIINNGKQPTVAEPENLTKKPSVLGKLKAQPTQPARKQKSTKTNEKEI